MNTIFTKKNYSYFTLIFFLLVRIVFFVEKIYAPILDLVFFGILLILNQNLLKKRTISRNYQNNLAKTVLIITIIYFILYYLLGLVIGFNRNSYNTSFGGCLYNFIFFILPLLFREEIRRKFILSNKDKKSILFVTSIFIGYEIFSFNFLEFQNSRELFESVFSVFLPIIVENIILSYLAFIGNRYTVYSYFIPSLVFKYFVPIIPDLDWFYRLLSVVVLDFVIYSTISREYLILVERKSRVRVKAQNYGYISSCCFILILGLFVAGVFKYQPVAILTFSMEPVFTRGDAVVIQKLDSKEKKALKKGDIIQYRKGNIVVIHRIIDSYNVDGEKVYVLKGDNNRSKDSKDVYDDQILGKVIFSIPKIGYPSVWLSEALHSSEDVDIEVGR